MPPAEPGTLGPSMHLHVSHSRVLWTGMSQSVRAPIHFSLITASYWNICFQADGLERQTSKGKLNPRRG